MAFFQFGFKKVTDLCKPQFLLIYKNNPITSKNSSGLLEELDEKPM